MKPLCVPFLVPPILPHCDCCLMMGSENKKWTPFIHNGVCSRTHPPPGLLLMALVVFGDEEDEVVFLLDAVVAAMPTPDDITVPLLSTTATSVDRLSRLPRCPVTAAAAGDGSSSS